MIGSLHFTLQRGTSYSTTTMAALFRTAGLSCIRRSQQVITPGILTARHISVGSPLPDVDLCLDSPTNKINVRELFKGKKGVLFSVLGAFTPGCTQNHIPEYLGHYDKFKELGYDVLACVAVNDPFVMSAWGKAVAADGKIMMLSDPSGSFTKAMNMELDCRKVMGNIRSKRYSVVVHDGVVQGFNGEPDHTGLACLLCIKNFRTPEQKQAG